MASPWGKPRNWDLGSQNLVHRGTGLSTFVGKGSGLGTTKQRKTSTYGPADWRKSSSSLSYSHYGTVPRRSSSPPKLHTPLTGTRSNLNRASTSSLVKETRSKSTATTPHGTIKQPLARSRSSAAVSQSYIPRMSSSVARSNSSTFTPSGLSKSTVFSQAGLNRSNRSSNRLKKSYSTATISRNDMPTSKNEAESLKPEPGNSRSYLRRPTVSALTLKRSRSNDSSTSLRSAPSAPSTGSGMSLKRGPLSSRYQLSDAVLLSRETREKHRDRPENVTKVSRSKSKIKAKENLKSPPVSIQNISSNRVLRSSSQTALSRSVGHSVSRSRSIGVMTEYQSHDGKQVKGSQPSYTHRDDKGKVQNPIRNTDNSYNSGIPHRSRYQYQYHYQSPYAQSRTGYSVGDIQESHSFGQCYKPASRTNYLRNSGQELRSSSTQNRFINLQPFDARSGGNRKDAYKNDNANVNSTRTRSKDLQRPLSSNKYFRSDSEDGDDTLFDCTQISSESDLEISMLPKREPTVYKKPSFQEIRSRMRWERARIPCSRSMSPNRRQCLVQLHQVSFTLQQPPTCAELAEFYKDPSMTPRKKSSWHLHQEQTKTTSRKRKANYNLGNPTESEGYDSYFSSEDSSINDAIMSFNEYERRLTANRTSDILIEQGDRKQTSPERTITSKTLTKGLTRNKATMSSSTHSSLQSTSLSSVSSDCSNSESQSRISCDTEEIQADTHFSETSANVVPKRRSNEGKSPEFQTENLMSFSESSIPNEEEVIAELQQIIEREEIALKRATEMCIKLNYDGGSERIASSDKNNLGQGDSHERLLSDKDIDSDIKLLSSSLSEDNSFKLNDVLILPQWRERELKPTKKAMDLELKVAIEHKGTHGYESAGTRAPPLSGDDKIEAVEVVLNNDTGDSESNKKSNYTDMTNESGEFETHHNLSQNTQGHVDDVDSNPQYVSKSSFVPGNLPNILGSGPDDDSEITSSSVSEGHTVSFTSTEEGACQVSPTVFILKPRPGSPPAFIRPIRTTLSPSTLALLQKRSNSRKATTTESQSNGFHHPIRRHGSGGLTSSEGNLDVIKTSKDTLSNRLSNPLSDGFPKLSHPPDMVPLPDSSPEARDTFGILPESSPEVQNTSGTLPDQRPYYRTVVIGPLSPETATTSMDTSMSESYSTSTDSRSVELTADA